MEVLWSCHGDAQAGYQAGEPLRLLLLARPSLGTWLHSLTLEQEGTTVLHSSAQRDAC